MQPIFKAEEWHNLYLLIGTATASLVGLFFIATSLHLDDVMRNQILRLRARNVMMAMLLLTVQSSVVLIPQSPIFLGVEIIGLNIAIVQFPIGATLRMRKAKSPIPIVRIGGGMAGCLLAMVGGATLLSKSQPAFYLVAAGNLLLVTILVSNAWALMLGVWETESPTSTR